MSKYRLFGRLPAHRKFAKPLTVTINREVNGYYTVTDEHTYNYGYQPTRGEAIAEYKRMLVADFDWLDKQRHCLHPSLLEEYEWTKEIVVWR